MSITIDSYQSTKFKINGIPHFRNFQPVVAGEKISILGVYDSSFVLLPPTHYSDFTVNGAGFVSVVDLQDALLPVLYSRSGLGETVLNGDITDVTLTNYILQFILADTSEINIDLSQISTNQSNISSHVGNNNNPHGVTKEQLGLGSVDNTSDLQKPISNAVSSALNAKADKGFSVISIAAPGSKLNQWVIGQNIPGINSGGMFIGYSIVDTPTTDAHLNPKMFK